MNKSWLRAGITTLMLSPIAHAARGDVGATRPWTTYEAEAGHTNASVLGPDYTGQTAAREASGRRCVRLAAVGDYVEIVAKDAAQGIVVRYSIPDSGDGKGDDATLGLCVNGQLRQRLALTSKFSHLYGRYPFSNEPAAGTPRDFWDEVRLLPGEIRAGDVVRLQKDVQDKAVEYFIDLIDLEAVPPATTKPDDALSVTDFGAQADDAIDDRAGFVAAIDAAKKAKKIVWIPPGRYVVKGAIDVSDVTIRGAGMWHTTLVGVDDYTPANRVAFYGRGSNIHLSDFSIVGKLNYRNDAEANDGIGESFGTGSSLKNLWIEHTKVGAWLVNADGLVVEGCRFRNTVADGINLSVGMANATVTNCSTRGTGDDGFAIWPANYAAAKYTPGGNRITHCTAQLPFLAQGFSIYGGDGNAVRDCLAVDIPYGCGLFASSTFPTDIGFRGTTVFSSNKVIRAGDREGAIGIVANRTPISDLSFENIDINDGPNDGVRFVSVGGQRLMSAKFDGIRIHNFGTAGKGFGVVAADDAVGVATFNHITVEGAKSGALRNVSPNFQITLGDGTSSLSKAAEQAEPTAGKK